MSTLIQDAEIAQHTMPNQEELMAQARLSNAYIGCHRKGESCLDVRMVEDGYAFRLMGSDESTPWSWMRTTDFERSFQVLSNATAELTYLYRLTAVQASLYHTAVSLMNGKMINKFRARMARLGIKMSKKDVLVPF